MDKFYCPYCNEELIKFPSKKVKCKKCGKSIFIKQRPVETEKKIVTKEIANEIEMEWRGFFLKKAKEKDGIINKYKINDKEFLERYDKLNDLYGRRPKLKEIESMILIDCVSVFNEYKDLKRIYLDEAIDNSNNGKDPFEYLKKARICELYELKKAGVDSIQIICFKDRCKFYKSVHKKEYNIYDAIKFMPIPKKECTIGKNGKCYAFWNAIF